MSCVLIDARTRSVSSETRNSPPSTGSVSSVSSVRTVRSSTACTLHRDLSHTHGTASGKTFSICLLMKIIRQLWLFDKKETEESAWSNAPQIWCVINPWVIFSEINSDVWELSKLSLPMFLFTEWCKQVLLPPTILIMQAYIISGIKTMQVKTLLEKI